MTKTLLKKQMMELFSFFWQDKKKNKMRTGDNLVLFVLLYLLLFGMMAFLFYMVADMLCEPLVMAGLGWLYFSLTGLIGIALGVFGSVFNTYASLYCAKDNEFLLAMPISASKILLMRLTGVYAMGLMYELLVMIPVLLKYFITAGPGAAAVAGSVLITFVISIFVLTLSAVLGWGVALISTKTKRKSLITVALSLIFIAAYYYAYGMAAGLLQEIASDPQKAGGWIRGRFSPLYHMGLAAEGNPLSLLYVSVLVSSLFALVYLLLAKSYRKIATANKGEAKVQYKERRASVHSVQRALLGKEFRRFLGSSAYMLNCGLGIVLMVIAAIALLFKADMVTETAFYLFAGEEEPLALIAAAAVCMMASMNDITAPSVSLEGNNLWLLQSFPVSGRQVLMAKLGLHLILTLIPAAVLTVSVELVLKPSPVFAVLIPASVVSFILFMALFGLVVNLKMPNLTWTSEIVPIKQSMGVMIVLFGSWALVVALAGLYVLLRNYLSPPVYLAAASTVLLAGSAALFSWVKNAGARIFENLQAGS